MKFNQFNIKAGKSVLSIGVLVLCVLAASCEGETSTRTVRRSNSSSSTDTSASDDFGRIADIAEQGERDGLSSNDANLLACEGLSDDNCRGNVEQRDKF